MNRPLVMFDVVRIIETGVEGTVVGRTLADEMEIREGFAQAVPIYLVELDETGEIIEIRGEGKLELIES